MLVLKTFLEKAILKMTKQEAKNKIKNVGRQTLRLYINVPYVALMQVLVGSAEPEVNASTGSAIHQPGLPQL